MAPAPPEPSITRLRIDLRLLAPASFHFHHGRVLLGLVSAAWGAHLPEASAVVACESGRVAFYAGEPYRLGLVVAKPECPPLGQLQQGFATIGAAHKPPLLGRFTVEELQVLPAPDLAAEAARLDGCQELTLQLISPLRLKRPRDLQRRGGAYLDRSCFPPGHLLDRLWRRVFLFRHGRYPSAAEVAEQKPPLPDETTATTDHLLWLDVPDKPGATMGGVIGRLTLHGVPAEWHPVLVAGQYVHWGQGCHSGLGRYLIHECSDLAAEPLQPSRSLRERISDRGRLHAALAQVCSNTTSAGVDHTTPEAALADGEQLVDRLLAELASGDYRPQPLRGMVLEVEGRKPRPLAVPTIADRTLQRAACELLAPAIDTLLEECSFAYRKGLSRSAAAVAIERAYADGYRWVLDADISSFFDVVDWSRLSAKLDALLPFEPLLDTIRAWVAAPVQWQGREIQREQGLPQGAVISPLLANLFLDELDEELLGEGYRLVRYADDFIVLCRDLDEARRAAEDARAALAGLGLELNPEKTGIRSFEQGFSYLGYLFCRSLVIEARDQDRAPDLPAAPPPHSWLAAVETGRSRRLQTGPGGIELRPLRPADAANEAPDRLPLYVTGHDVELSLQGETLRLERPDGNVELLPIRSLRHLVLIGRTRATVPLLLTMARLGVPVYFCRRSGELFHVSTPHAPDWQLWLRQAEVASRPELCLDIARSMVAARLHNQAVLAGRLQWQGAAGLGEQLRSLEEEAGNADSSASLRGLEGRGAAFFFQALAANLDPEWGFETRQRRPPPDPVNAMLSFAYTLLHHHVATALVAAGLNPRIGLYHHGRGRHDALASDLQEELRWLAEAHVWSMVRRRELKPADFQPSPDGRHPCLLQWDARRTFIGRFEDRLLTEFTPEGADEPVSYRAFIDAQARALRERLAGRSETYRPLRRRR
jgi:CRISPR-associated protein Cas1